MPDLRKLQEEALTAASAGDWARASDLYASLEKTDPGEAIWALRLGECLRKLGRGDDAVKALTRALKSYGLANLHQKAAAVGRLILAIEPAHAQVRQIMAALDASAGHTPPPPPSAAELAPDTSEPPGLRESRDFAVPAWMRRAERVQREATAAGSPVVAATPPAPTVTSDASSAASRPIPRVILPRTRFMSAMNARQLHTVNARARLRSVEAKEILFALGDPADALYLVAAGRIAVLAPNEITCLERGDFFGEEVAVLPDQSRLATLRAAEASQVLVLDRALVAELIGETPGLLDILAESLRERLLAMFVRTSPLLASLTLNERSRLLSQFSVGLAEPDDVIVDPAARSVCVLLAGEAQVSLDGRLTEAVLAGDVVGETAVVLRPPVSTTARARTRCLFLSLPAAAVETLRDCHPQVFAYLGGLAANRLERLREATGKSLGTSGSLAVPPRVFLAHHHLLSLRSYANALASRQLVVDSTSDPEVAMRIIANERFDVVICDTEWLAEAGYDPLGDIRRRDLDVPIILTTPDAGLDTTGAAASHGVVASFVEPFDIEELVGAATRAVRFSRLARLQREARSCLDPAGEWMGDRAGLELHFGSALDRLWMAFQPIVSTSARDVFAFEALLRSGEEILRSPAAVLRAAERLHRVHDVGRIARDSVAATVAESAAPPTLFVNVHHQDLLDEHLLDPRAPLSSLAPRVVLEISERTPLDELADLRNRIRSLRGLGYRFAIDNVGAGHAGVATLAQLEPDIAKLDISLIHGMDRDPVKQGLVGSLLQACRELDIQAICEGVETELERDWLLHLGADLMQGYLFAKPGPPFPAVNLATLARRR
jgi:EAL domain-containing protein (putative c-di-GMP-specific phosphodiesterase class I)/CRP-like cAMP-binding protein